MSRIGSWQKQIITALSLTCLLPQSVWAQPRAQKTARAFAQLAGGTDSRSQAASLSKEAANELDLASKAFAGQNFERARPHFDRAFLIALKMPVSEQKIFLGRVSEIINSSSDRQDYDVYKYFAQKRLALLKLNAKSSPTERYNEVQTIAFSCSQNHRYKEALSLLQATLADLQSTDPQSDSIGWCLYTLARVSEDSGDLKSACSYYDKQLAFTRATPEKRNYHRALESYTMFLITHKMQKELLPVSSAFLAEIDRTHNTDRVPLQMIAQGLAPCAPDLADKFYRLAFEYDKRETQSAMNIPYGDLVCDWAKLLHSDGKTDKAIAVLKEGMAFCRTARWPDALERNMPQMAKLLQQYLSETNRSADANQVKDAFSREIVTLQDKRIKEKEARIAQQINSPQVDALTKVRALMERADMAFNAKNCALATSSVEQAVAVYEAHAAEASSEQIYNSLYNISRRYAACGRSADCKPLLIRIVKARMVYGFQDPLERTYWSSNCGGTTWAFDELVGPFNNQASTIEKELMDMARSSGKISNVIYVTDQMASHTLGPRRLELQQELAKLRSGNKNKGPELSTMLVMANDLTYYKKWDEAMSKCEEALALYQANKGNLTAFRSMPGSFYNIGRQFVTGGRIEQGTKLILLAYKLSLDEDRDAIIALNLRILDEQIKVFADKHDNAGAAKFIEDLVSITNAKLGPDNTFTRMWLIKQSTFYLNIGDTTKARKSYEALASSLFKPGLSVSKDNEESLAGYAKALKQHGLGKEATKIESKLSELEKQHCGAH